MNSEIGRSIVCFSDIKNHIRYRSEQQFALHILQENPEATVIYQPEEFIVFEDGKQRSTIPDFLIITEGEEKYVEITQMPLPEYGPDPKEKQKRIMEKAAPNAVYDVLYQDDLLRIQRTNPGFDPNVSPKRIKERRVRAKKKKRTNYKVHK